MGNYRARAERGEGCFYLILSARGSRSLHEEVCYAAAVFAAKRWRAVRVAFAPVLADGHGGKLNISERLQAFLLLFIH